MTIKFEMTDGINTFRDAIVLADGVTMTDAEIEAMKQQRFNDWLIVINTPPVEE